MEIVMVVMLLVAVVFWPRYEPKGVVLVGTVVVVVVVVVGGGPVRLCQRFEREVGSKRL